MHIICQTSRLLEYLNIVSKAVANRTTMSILQCILLIADEKGFRLISNDLKLAIETETIEAEIIEEGILALDALIFVEIIRRLPGEEVTIQKKAGNLVLIHSNASEFKIMSKNTEEFPRLPEFEKENEYQIETLDLKNLISQTSFAVSLDESKGTMTGELLEIKDNKIKCVAVDGFRVAYSFANGNESFSPNKAIIPAKTMQEVAKLLQNSKHKSLSIFYTKKHIVFDLQFCIVVSTILEGEFINYENVFTDEYTTLITVNRSILLESLERVSLIASEAKKTPVKLSIESNQLTISANTEMGTSYDELPIILDGNELIIAFNPRYIIDILKVMTDEKVNIQFTTPLSPAIIRGEEYKNYEFLVLPLRMKN